MVQVIESSWTGWNAAALQLSTGLQECPSGARTACTRRKYIRLALAVDQDLDPCYHVAGAPMDLDRVDSPGKAEKGVGE